MNLKKMSKIITIIAATTVLITSLVNDKKENCGKDYK